MSVMRRVALSALLVLLATGSPAAAQLRPAENLAAGAGAAAANVLQNGVGANLPAGSVAAGLLQNTGGGNLVQGATANILNGVADAAGKLLPGNVFDILSGPSNIQQDILKKLPKPFGKGDQTLFLDLMQQQTPLGFAAKGSSAETKSGLANLLKIAPGDTRANPAAGGVVAASLLLSSGICVTVAGGLGTGYAAMGEALTAINQLAGRVNLGLEYAKTGLALTEDIAKTRQEYVKAVIESGALPDILKRTAQIRASMAGTLVPQLQSLRGRLSSVRDKITAIGNVANLATGGLAR